MAEAPESEAAGLCVGVDHEEQEADNAAGRCYSR